MPIKDPQAKRLSPDRLEKTHFTLTAISQLPGYVPQRKEFGAENVTLHQEAIRRSREAEIAAENALAKARDAAARAEWEAYSFSLSAAEQVMGQFGSDSDEYASLGYKKKSEYKKTSAPKREKPAGSQN